MWWSFCLMAFTTNGECYSWYLASNIRKVPKKSGCWKNAVGYAAYCTQPPWKGSSPPPPHPYRCQPLDRLILYPPPPTSICTTKSPQWWRNKSTWRLCHGPYFALLLRLLPHFPPIVQVSRFVGGKKRNDTAHSHHQGRCKKWIISNFLHFLGIPLSGQTRTTVIVWPNQQFWESENCSWLYKIKFWFHIKAYMHIWAEMIL